MIDFRFRSAHSEFLLKYDRFFLFPVFLSVIYLLRDIIQIWLETANARVEADIVNGLDDDRYFTDKYLSYLKESYSV